MIPGLNAAAAAAAAAVMIGTSLRRDVAVIIFFGMQATRERRSWDLLAIPYGIENDLLVKIYYSEDITSRHHDISSE